MKTSSKLLIGVTLVLLSSITILMGVAKIKIGNSETGNGIKHIEKRLVKNFSGLQVAGDAAVHIRQADQFSLTISGDKNLLPLVTSEIRNQILLINLPNTRNNEDTKIEVSAPLFTSITLSTGAKALTENELSGSGLDLVMKTGTAGDFKVNYSDLNCDASTGCKITLTGKANRASFEASTGCTINALELPVKDCKVVGKTGVQLKVNVSGNLEVDLGTGSSLKYSGSPTVKVINVSTGSTIRKAD